MQTELHSQIVKTGVFSVQFHTATTNIHILQTNASFKNKRQRVNGCIRSRIQRIDLCSIPKSKSNSPHRLAIPETLIGQVAIAISCIRRVCIILSDCHSGNHREQKRTKCVFKSYHYYSLKFYLILSTLKIYLQR